MIKEEKRIMNIRACFVPVIFCIISIILVECTTSQPSRFYLLNALEDSRKQGIQSCQKDSIIGIGINPVNLPRYLDRPQIMTRINDNELMLSELDLWAEPLRDNVTSVIAQNLHALKCADIEVFPWSGSKQINYRLSAMVIRLDGTPGGEAYLDVRWTILDEQAKMVLLTKESRFIEPVGSQDYLALASAYSRLLASFSRELADSFKSISQGKLNP